MKYRKKPIDIEAWRLPMSDGASRAFDGDPNIIFKRENGAIVEAIISTLEGTMVAWQRRLDHPGCEGRTVPVQAGHLRCVLRSCRTEPIISRPPSSGTNRRATMKRKASKVHHQGKVAA